VPGDYDGDTDFAVLRPSDGKWYIDDGVYSWTWWGGVSTDIPVPGDYDGDGDTDHAVYNDGTWYVKDQFIGYWGDSSSTPVPADYDGDGTTEMAVYRLEGSEGMWYIEGQGPNTFSDDLTSCGSGWGNTGSIPVPGDFDGNGQVDVAVYNDGTWYIKDQFVDNWGDALSYPLPAPDTNGDGDPYQ